jgi:inner membrane transporter RhtA
VGTLVLLPVGIADGGYALLDPRYLLAGLGVAILSSAVPYSLELEALRKLPTRVFGVLMSLEPAVAALVGFLVLDELLASAPSPPWCWSQSPPPARAVVVRTP